MQDKTVEKRVGEVTWNVKILKDFKPVVPNGFALEIERERKRILSELVIQPKLKPVR